MINFPGKQQYNGEDLYRIVKILRGEGGCPGHAYYVKK